MISRFPKLARLSACLISIILFLTSTLNVQAQDGDTKPRTVMLKRGQILEMSLVNPLDSGHTQVGEDVTLTLTRPVIAAGAEVLPPDWIVRGRVTDVTRAGKNCRAGQIKWSLDRLTMTDGKKIKVRRIGEYFAKSNGVVLEQVSLDPPKKRSGRVITNIATGVAIAPVLILLSPFLVLMAISMSGEGGCNGAMGEESVIASGTIFYAAVSNDVQQSIH